jgi:hypothetical protein
MMKRNVTFMLAVFTLLACLIAPIGMWGQKPVNNNSEMTRTESVVTWDATAANNFGSTISQVNGTNTGSISTGSFSWNYVNTLTYLKSNKSDHQSFLNTGFIQIGSSNAYHRLELSTSAIPGTIKSVSVECSSANGAHKLTIVVGSTNYKNAVSTPSGQPTENGNYVITGTGNASGAISILLAPGSGALYIKSISVTYEETNLTPTAVTIEPNSGFSNDLNNSPSGGLLVATVTANNQPIQASVTWASSNTNVATVNANGVVTLVAVGQTDITATYAGDNTYAGSVGTYQLNVINSAPYATATPSTLNSFSYNEGYGPSAIQTISVEGANLASNVIVELDGQSGSSFEISQDGTNWTSSIVLTPNSGVVAPTSISVRMKAGLVSGGTAYSDQLRVKYNGGNMASINLSGSVNTITIMTVAEARAVIAQGAPYPTGVYVSGIVTRRYSDNLSNGRLSYYISDDGTQTNEMEAYQGKGLNGANFTSATDIEPGDVVVIYGDLYYHSSSSTYELNTGNYLYSWRRPATLTVSNLSNVETFVFNAADQNTLLLEGEGSCVFDAGDEVMISVSAESGYILSTFTVNGVDHLNDIEADAYTFTINQNTTVTATAVQAYNINYSVNGVLTQAQVPGSFQLPTSANLNSDEFVFAGWTTNPNVVTGFSTAGTTVNVQGGETFYAVYGKTIADGPATTVYQEVTTAPANGNWAGDYLIVSNNANVLNTHTGNANTNTSGTYVDISQYYNNGVIEYNSTTSAYEITAAATTNGYSLYDNGDEAYLGYNTTSNDNNNTGAKLRWDDEFSSIYNEWTLGVGSIVSVYKTNRAIRWNNSQHYFAMYALSGVEPIQLFKKISTASTTTTYYTRVFINETAAANMTITGPSIIPSGSILDMGNYYLANNLGAANLVIEDGGQLIRYGQVNATMRKNIAGCVYNSNNNAGYYLIASPLAVAPTNVANMLNTTDGYDLYYYDGNKTLEEWVNYKEQNDGGYSLVRGKGYLYANGADATLEFAGTINGIFDGIEYLTYNANSHFGSLNLVGNPYSFENEFCVYDYNYYDDENTPTVNANYYSINSTGDDFIAGVISNKIVLDPMEAILIQATNSIQHFRLFGDTHVIAGGTLPTIPIVDGKKGIINLNISKPQGLVIDRAIVRFDNGGQLPKFQLNPNNTKIYFTEDNKDFAVVRSANEGDMPVSFRAAENGIYSLSVEVSDTEMAYLHLIDNKTGVDVDLLANPSYTFEANANDYESRFRLVFNATGVEENNTNETFAFFNGSEWVINTTGNATLQVVDMMGRVLSSEQINGNTAVNLNQAAGIYVLRLVNGENVMVQKVVVR